jgi:hypothetical protein
LLFAVPFYPIRYGFIPNCLFIAGAGFDAGRYCAVVSTTKMQVHAGNEKSCVWHAADFADGEVKEEMFAIRFGSLESEFFSPPLHVPV